MKQTISVALSTFLLATLPLLSAASTAAASQEDPAMDQLNALIVAQLPKINTALQGAIPASYGDCSAGAPQPCENVGHLYYEHKSWEYLAIARWAAGLKTISLNSGVASRSNDPSGIALNIAGLFASLPVSIYIGECFTFDDCSILWDNTYACCGSNKHFSIDVAIVCGTDRTSTHYPIDSFVVKGVHLDKLEITEQIVGISVNVEDITGTVASKVSSVLTDYLTTETFLPGANHSSVTLVEYLNSDPMIAQVAGFFCNSTGNVFV